MTPSQPSFPARVEHWDTIVIGGGQAGLATGHQLAERDQDFVILDAAERTGDSWRERWDSLRLFTPAAYSGLPGLRFPAHPSHLPDKDEVAEYLERYADRFDLPIRHGVRVDSVEWDGRHYQVRSGAARYQANSMVVATGPFQKPHVPEISADMSRGIAQLHSSEYRTPFTLPDGDALVVGAGNSGAQIAMELARFRTVWLAGREIGRLPRTLLGRDIYDWIWPMLDRFTADTRTGRKLREKSRRGDPLVGIAARDITDAGVVRVGRVSEVRDGLPICDGEPLEPRVIVWCTGFRPDYSWLRVPVFDDAGRPVHERGVASGSPDLYFVGLRFQYRQTSALIGGVGRDAAYIAGEIARRSEVDSAA